jgi:hypothetical protein
MLLESSARFFPGKLILPYSNQATVPATPSRKQHSAKISARRPGGRAVERGAFGVLAGDEFIGGVSVCYFNL